MTLGTASWPIRVAGAAALTASAACLALVAVGHSDPIDGPALARQTLTSIGSASSADICTIGSDALSTIKKHGADASDQAVASAAVTTYGDVPCTWGGYVNQANGGSSYQYSYPGQRTVVLALHAIADGHPADESIAHRLGQLGVATMKDSLVKTADQSYHIGFYYTQAVLENTTDASQKAGARAVLNSQQFQPYQDFLTTAR